MLAANSSACQVMTFIFGISEVCFLPAPIGNCDTCCPRDDAVDIQYQLYTRENPRKFQLLPMGDIRSLSLSNFNAANPTVIYLMGFSESSKGASTTGIKNAYLKRGNYNVITVDWSRLVAFPWYLSAVRNTRYMGKNLADFVTFLDGAGIKAAKLHIVGFSLGAEAAGFSGKELRRRGLLVGRITGLDPAYPGYKLTSRDGHLSKGDASFVDVLHTNPGVFGFPTAIGDVDFYANPGMWIQPGCRIDELIVDKDLEYFYGCSHNRAWRYFIESILDPRRYPATLCSDWTSPFSRCRFRSDSYAGFGARSPMSGKMYFNTNRKPPFGRSGP